MGILPFTAHPRNFRPPMNGSALESRMVVLRKKADKQGMNKPRWFDPLTRVVEQPIKAKPKPSIEVHLCFRISEVDMEFSAAERSHGELFLEPDQIWKDKKDISKAIFNRAGRKDVRSWKNSGRNKFQRQWGAADIQSAEELASAAYLERQRKIDADEQWLALQQIQFERMTFRLELDQERDREVRKWWDARNGFPLLQEKYNFGEWNHETAPEPDEEDDFLYGSTRPVERTVTTVRQVRNDPVVHQYAF